MTEPALPVVHGTTLTLNCPGAYTNLGGNTATCLYGQVVLTNGSPDCKLRSKFSTKLCYIFQYGQQKNLSQKGLEN